MSIFMLIVRYLCCVNSGAFVMKFKAEWESGQSGWTGDFHMGESRSIDLANFTIAHNGEVWPVVHAELGNTVPGPRVLYDPGSHETATYQVKGTTLHYSVELLGPS